MKKTDTEAIIRDINKICNRRGEIRLMEICGTHTVAFFRSGLKSLMPANLKLISGPGCPVCVTSQGYIDAACQLASKPATTVCTYGDMVRVPGKLGSLAEKRAEGGHVVIVYSTRDAMKYAVEHPDETVVFLAVGFETTTPATASVVIEAKAKSIRNFMILPGHKLVVPAMMALLSSGDVPIDGFMCPGHVSVIIGANAYKPITDKYRKPCVVTGFEPIQMLSGIAELVRQIAHGEANIGNVYGAVVKNEGNPVAQKLMSSVFEPATVCWRAIGKIPESGLALRKEYKDFDATSKYELNLDEDYEMEGCLCGKVLQGKIEPMKCPLFGKACTPAHPIGPCMVSSEGTCAAWYKYHFRVDG